jgi:hypothetical protein
LEESENNEHVVQSSKAKNKVSAHGPSSKMGLYMGFFLLFFVFGTLGYNMVLSDKVQKPSPTNVINLKSGSSKDVTIKSPQPSSGSAKIIDEAKKSAAYILSQLLRTGEKAGAAVLGISVKFMQYTATKSAPIVASAAAKMVLQSAAPAIVQQINKLPPDERKQVTQLLCK